MRKKNMKIYVASIIGMFCLVILALFLPQIVFGIQDRYQMNNTKVEQRSSINISQINADYELEMYERMSNLLLLDLEKVTVAAIDYDRKDDEELNALLERTLYGEWIDILNNITIYFFNDALTKAFIEVQDCKKYIVYGKDYQDGVALMMWYFDLYMKEADSRIRLLVDSETDSIYYIKITSYSGQNGKASETTNAVTGYTTDKGTWFSTFVEILLMHMAYYSDYYKADDYWYIDSQWDDTNSMCKYSFAYGETTLEFQFSATDGEGIKPDIEMGITSIGNLIPEMMQN